MKKSTVDGIDVYEPNKGEGDTVIYDARNNRSTTPTYGVEYDGVNPAKMVCFICNLKTTDKELFLHHVCSVKGDEKKV